MGSYIIRKRVDGNKKFYDIFENLTSQVLRKFDTYSGARVGVKISNSTGFQGFTPTFMLRELKRA
jgi:hypothetical protein